MPVLPEHCRLSEREHLYRYQLIVADLFASGEPSVHPRVVVLGGQPGSGKTKMRELAEEAPPSVTINADDFRDYHPMYEKLKLSEPERASFLVNEDVSLWTQKLIRQAVEEKRHIVFDGTFGTSDQNLLKETLAMFKEAGYESQLWVLAVPAEFSKLGIYLRHEIQIAQTGSGRFVSMKVHDLNYRNIPANIDMAVQNSLLDQVCIFSRSVKLFDNKFVNNRINHVRTLSKTDADFSKAAELFLQLRDEPLSAVLEKYFSFRMNEVAAMMDSRINRALKTNDMAKVNLMTKHKDQFLKDLSVNRNKNHEITY